MNDRLKVAGRRLDTFHRKEQSRKREMETRTLPIGNWIFNVTGTDAYFY